MSRSIGRTNTLSLQKLKEIFEDLEEVHSAVLFGSRAVGGENPMSDYDVAIWIDQPMGGLEDPYFTLYAELPGLMKIQECDLDLVDLRRADELLKQSIMENYQIIKGNKDEISRILGENQGNRDNQRGDS